MKVLEIRSKRDPVLDFCAERIKEGAVVIYPTDTVYGIGCIMLRAPVDRIFEIKERPLDKALSLAFSDMIMVKKYAVLKGEEEAFIKKRILEPYTFIVRKRKTVPDFVIGGRDTVGVRIPDNNITKTLIKKINGPIITTSANRSGKNAPRSVDEIDRSIIDEVDLVLDGGSCRLGRPSKIVDLTKKGAVLRDS